MKIMALEYCYEPRNETEIFLRDFKKIFLNTSAEKNITENTPQTGSVQRLCSAVMKMLDDEFRDPEKFIEKFAEAIEREDEIKMEDEFRTYDEWSSIAYLSVIAFMDDEYDTQIEEADFKKLRTVQDLYDACTKK